MKATPQVVLPLLLSLFLIGTVRAEYPFDPMVGADPGAVVGADPFDTGGYGPDPFLYEDPYPPLEGLFASESPVLPGWISGTINAGTKRFIYGGELFQPVFQAGQTIGYLDFRLQGDDHSSGEFNFGGGVRMLSDPGWVFGFYTFWDHLRSSHGNHFNQGTLGIEAMSVFWDARFNVYFPESKAKGTGTAGAGVSNGTVVKQAGLERAYWGWDMEVGHLLWAAGPGAQHELRGYLAVYHFDHSANTLHSITGPRGRLEWRCYDLPYFGPGSRFTCGLTAQHDRVRDGQLFAFMQLRIPLDVWAHHRRPLSPLHRRMLDPIVRDVDVVTHRTLLP